MNPPHRLGEQPRHREDRIFGQAAAWGASGMVSVTTTSSIGLFMMRSIAGPESTAWVAQA